MVIEEIKEAFWEQKPTLRDIYNVGSIGIFGSHGGVRRRRKAT